MTDPRLVKYVQDKLAEGYDKKTLSAFLVDQGYPPAEVQDVIGSSPSRVPDDGSHAKMVLIGLLVLGLIVIGSLSVIFLDFSGSSPALNRIDVDTRFLSDRYEPGKPLAIEVKVVDVGSKDAHQVFLSYRVRDKATKNVVFFKQETINLQGEKTSERQLYLPEDLSEGKYLLETEATVDQKTFLSSFTFDVQPTGEKTPPVALEGPAETGATAADEGSLVNGYRIIQEDPSLTRKRVKTSTLPEGRTFNGMVVARLAPE
ncbi:MAG: hypothetical protein GXP63_07705 [DPANN group archaeon]|nr:hypothetical protein [DPANN group archaeon]